MIHPRINHIAAVIPALALTIALALTTTGQATARTFNFNANGSMVQQTLPARVASSHHARTRAVAAAHAGYGYGDTPSTPH